MLNFVALVALVNPLQLSNTKVNTDFHGRNAAFLTLYRIKDKKDAYISNYHTNIPNHKLNYSNIGFIRIPPA
jgi:hypothetical protein